MRSIIGVGNHPSLSASWTFLVAFLPPPQFSLLLVFSDIMVTKIDICRMITCVEWR